MADLNELDIVQICREYGAANVRVYMEGAVLQHTGIIPGVAFRTSDSPKVNGVGFMIDESWGKVTDGYKIHLKPVSVPDDVCDHRLISSERFYIDGFQHLASVSQGFIDRVVVITPDGETTVYRQQPLSI